MSENPAVDSQAPHLVTRTIHEEVWVPEHMPRTSTAAYRRIHHQMVVIEDRPCLVCGVRNSTLHDPTQNRYDATAIETHHHIVEWSLANCISLDKFNARIVARLHAEGKPGYEQPFTEAEMLAWIDHDRDNLWPLCNVHHRGVHAGIHYITDPIWSAQDLIKEGYTLVPADSTQVADDATTKG